jgi:hypothetical protein
MKKKIARRRPAKTLLKRTSRSKITVTSKKKTRSQSKRPVPAKPEPQRNFNDTRSAWQLPHRYGQDALTLLVRDPWWLYAYWEITPATFEQTRARAHSDHVILRLYNVTDVDFYESSHFFDIEIGPADNWYIDVGLPNTEWVAELGLRAHDGRFYPMIRSNRVRTPRYGVSEIVDEEWMLPDHIYWKLFGQAGVAGGPSSFSAKDVLERYFKDSVSSESSSKLPKARGLTKALKL